MRKAMLAGWIVIVVLLVACRAAAPATTPVPAATPGAAATPSPGDAAWNKAVDEAKKEGKVVIYAATMVGDYAKNMGEVFKQKYGITVEFGVGRGAELREKIKTEQRVGQPVADLTEGGPTSHNAMRLEGFTASAKDLPVFKETGLWLAEPLLDPEGHLIRYSLIISTPIANTNLVKAGEMPKTWQDLLSPRWKGKMAIDDPTISGPGADWFAIAIKGQLSLEYMQKLAQQDLVIVRGYQELIDRLARGEHDIGVASVVDFALPSLEKGAPIKVLFLKEGAVALANTIGLVKTPAHPNAARLFINWLLSKEGQTAHATIKKAYTVRKDVTASPYPAIVAPKDIPVAIQSLQDSLDSVNLIKEGKAKLFKK